MTKYLSYQKHFLIEFIFYDDSAGKSTTINMLCGYLRPTSGTAEINGLDINTDMDQIHLQMGTVQHIVSSSSINQCYYKLKGCCPVSILKSN
jgi:ABC-type uncharacterized transport system ATPase subunit